MQSFLLNLRFKGDRNYYQGGDIYNAVQEIVRNHLDKHAWLKHIAFRGFARNVCELVLGEASQAKGEFIRAQCEIVSGNQSVSAVIIETEKKCADRYPFDENQVITRAALHDKDISQTSRAGFTPIEEVIVLTKYLHNKLFPAKDGRWIFSQLDLLEPFSSDPSNCYAIKLKQNLANRMTIADIIQDDRTIGKIRFTVTEA